VSLAQLDFEGQGDGGHGKAQGVRAAGGLRRLGRVVSLSGPDYRIQGEG